jgi:hypothetical protein
MMLAQSPEVEGWETVIEWDNGAPFACTATIFRVGKRPIVKRCLLSEWRMSSNPNWASRPAHMLEIRTLKHAARQIIHGLPLDADELRIIRAEEGTYSSTVVSKAAAVKAALEADHSEAFQAAALTSRMESKPAPDVRADEDAAHASADDDGPPWDDLAAEADARLDALAGEDDR